MPDPGRLTDDEASVLFDHISKYPDLECPLCHCTDWSVAEEIEHGVWVAPKERRQTGILAVTLICKDCCFIAQLAWGGIKERACETRTS